MKLQNIYIKKMIEWALMNQWYYIKIYVVFDIFFFLMFVFKKKLKEEWDQNGSLIEILFFSFILQKKF